ncbi:hypothetical protein GCM10027449_33000 [Sinomonas notoginsengisoli]|uniref:serine/threonine-protein kinase n=1 Tax=Sinomonas notoginsengisoli TaxID=1457311 RepID=UPI001F382F9D|nr:serine/threonine-protein kinase [Sinomonas notoginsengisoli]
MDALSPRLTGTAHALDEAAATASGEAPPVLTGYESVRPLGAGSAGTVWLVREESTGRLFAAKFLLPDSSAGAMETLEQARREVRVAQTRSHQHVLAVHQAVAAEGSSAGAVAILSDYAPGGSLGHLVHVRGHLSVGECVTVVAPIAQALASLHQDGTAHGDVSPGNILFTAEGMPLLGDFGLGRMVGEAGTVPGGTPGFSDPAAVGSHVPLAPSRAEPGTSAHGAAGPGSRRRLGSGSLAAAADVFALGAVAWFILTGEPPAPTRQRPPLSLLVEGVPAELTAAIEAALRDDPRLRPSADELARSVFRSARPASVDLAPAVDASVIPELLTRRREPASRPRLLRGRRAPGSGRRRSIGTGNGRAGGRRSGLPPWMLFTAAGVLMLATAAAAAWWIGALGRPGQGQDPAVGAAQQGQHAPAIGARAGLPESLRRGADSADPVQAVQALSEIRARAIGARDRDLLESVSAVGSEAAATDAALLDRLVADGQRLEGFSARVLSADLEPGATPTLGGPASQGAETAVVRVRIVTSGYAVKDNAGAAVGERPTGLDQELRIVLQRDGERWKVARIAAA